MNETRKDYILDSYVIIATERKKRPREFTEDKEEPIENHVCYFCPGNENLTPPEITRIEKNGKWQIRVVDNKFPAVKLEGNPEFRTDNNYFTFAGAFGKHEVVIDTPEHNKKFSEFSVEEITELLRVYIDRINVMGKIQGIKYVFVFKNYGKEGGASIAHSHSQIISYNLIPATIKKREDAVLKYDHCPYCDIINIEKDSHRKVMVNKSIIAFTPYASRFPFEVWVFPKRHVININELNDEELYDLASVLKYLTQKIATLNLSYNFYLLNGTKNMHFHIHFIPRTSSAKWAGFELGTDTIINPITPEEAAKFYRD